MTRNCYLRRAFWAASSLLMISLIAPEASASTAVPLEQTAWISEPITAIGNMDGGDAEIAVWQDNVYAVWSGSRGVMFAKSSDSGTTFSEPIGLGMRDPDSSVGLYPAVAAIRDDVYVVYSSGKDIFIVKSSNRGESFGDPINVSKTNIDSPYVVTEHVISLSGNNVYVAWTVASGNWADIYFAHSSDGGRTFNGPKNVSDTPDQPSQLARIASSGNQVYLAWYDIDEYYVINHVSFATSTDGGGSFFRINNLSANAQPHNAYEHNIAIGEDGIYAAWRDEGKGIVLAKSIDSGRTFETQVVARGGWPALAVQGDNVYLAFGVQENGTDNVGIVGSVDGGMSFSNPIMLSNHSWGLNPYDERPFPVIAADGPSVFVAWRYTASGTEDDHETFLAASYDEGRTFTRHLNLSQNGDGDTMARPVLLASPIDRMFLVWEEYASMKLAWGQIPETYTEPFREVSFMTPVEPYDPIVFVVSAGIAITAVAGGVFYYFKKRSRK